MQGAERVAKSIHYKGFRNRGRSLPEPISGAQRPGMSVAVDGQERAEDEARPGLSQNITVSVIRRTMPLKNTIITQSPTVSH
jgi:hypothetical protein